MSVLLFQERPTAWRRRPSQGDGGLDVGEPNPGGYHVYQIEGFTGSMTSSRRGQVDRSLQRILSDPRLDRPVTSRTSSHMLAARPSMTSAHSAHASTPDRLAIRAAPVTAMPLALPSSPRPPPQRC